MNSKVNVLLGLVAVLVLYLSSGVEARYLPETSKGQTNGSYGALTPGTGPVIPCPRGKPYTSCIPPPRSCSTYKRGRSCPPPKAGEVIEAKPQNQN